MASVVRRGRTTVRPVGCAAAKKAKAAIHANANANANASDTIHRQTVELLQQWAHVIRPVAGVSGWYSFPKTCLPAAVWLHMRQFLTAKPHVMMLAAGLTAADTHYAMFQETAHAVAIPRALGLQAVGAPWSDAHDRRTIGQPMADHCRFQGSLQASRRQPYAVRKLFRAWTDGSSSHVSMNMLSLPCGYGKTVTSIACALALVPAVVAFQRFQALHALDQGAHVAQLSRVRLPAWVRRPTVGWTNDDEQPAGDVLQELHEVSEALNRQCPTLFAAQPSDRLPRKTLIVVPSTSLLDQWKLRIQQCVPGARVGLIQQDTVEVDGFDFVIAIIHSLAKRHYPLRGILDQFGLVIVDEAHHLAAQLFCQTLPQLPARFVLGLSATLRRADGLGHALAWYMGPVAVHVSRPHAQGRIQVRRLWYRHGKQTELLIARGKYQGKPRDMSMQKLLAAEPARNEVIVQVILELVRKAPWVAATTTTPPRRHILVFSRLNAHLQLLKEMLAERGFTNAVVYTGKSLAKLKQSGAREALAASYQVLLSTWTYAREGLDVPTLDTMVQALPGGDMEQPVGRILRGQNNSSSNPPLIVDLVDPFSVFANRAARRLTYYRTQGFQITDLETHTQRMRTRQSIRAFWAWQWVSTMSPVSQVSQNLDDQSSSTAPATSPTLQLQHQTALEHACTAAALGVIAQLVHCEMPLL